MRAALSLFVLLFVSLHAFSSPQKSETRSETKSETGLRAKPALLEACMVFRRRWARLPVSLGASSQCQNAFCDLAPPSVELGGILGVPQHIWRRRP